MEMERIIRECAFDVFRGEELRFEPPRRRNARSWRRRN